MLPGDVAIQGMKISFDVSDLSTNRADGTTRYTYELAQRLPSLAATDSWNFHAPFDSATIHDITDRMPNVTKIIAPFPKYWTQLRLPLDLYRVRPEVLFMPIQQLPYVRPGKMTTVAVVHDLAFHRFPQQFTHKDWLLLHLFSAYAARQADAIIAVSQATARDVAHYYGRTRHVHVIHHGVDHERFRLPSELERAASWSKLHSTYPKLHQPYLLFVSQIQPRKNIIRLVEAFEQLRQSIPELQLVIAGGYGWLKQPILKRIFHSPAHEHIILAGHVPDELLPALYWHAEVFTLPSLYEGFGIPLLEAQACGTPVVTSNVSSMPEIVGDSAVLIDPNDTESLVAGLRDALKNKEELSRKGLANSQKFTWDNCAKQTLQILGV